MSRLAKLVNARGGVLELPQSIGHENPGMLKPGGLTPDRKSLDFFAE
jgi:hypothetical protein